MSEINTCFVCNELHLVDKHYTELMCNTCYHLCQRMRTKYRKETGENMTNDETLTKATTRRQQIRDKGIYVKNEHGPSANLTIFGRKEEND